MSECLLEGVWVPFPFHTDKACCDEFTVGVHEKIEQLVATMEQIFETDAYAATARVQVREPSQLEQWATEIKTYFGDRVNLSQFTWTRAGAYPVTIYRAGTKASRPSLLLPSTVV
jgi:hypothetical protein